MDTPAGGFLGKLEAEVLCHCLLLWSLPLLSPIRVPTLLCFQDMMRSGVLPFLHISAVAINKSKGVLGRERCFPEPAREPSICKVCVRTAEPKTFFVCVGSKMSADINTISMGEFIYL